MTHRRTERQQKQFRTTWDMKGPLKFGLDAVEVQSGVRLDHGTRR